MTDPIADMLTRIRNILMTKKSEVVIPYSKIKEQIADVLHREGYVTSYNVEGDDYKKNLVIQLKYVNGRPAISSLKRISKSGRRVYADKNSIPQVLNGLGITIISTSQGVMTGKESYQKGVGGEILCEIY